MSHGTRDKGTARLTAFHNITTAINVDEHLPNQVFLGEWSSFSFFESDHIFSGAFVKVMHEFIDVERAALCYLLNITRTHLMEFQEANSFTFEDGVTGNDYENKLQKGGPNEGWLYLMDRYACSSDRGEWCIYCERENDVAVIGFRGKEGPKKFKESLESLHAESIHNLMQMGTGAQPPFGILTARWREELLRGYGVIG